MRTAKAVVAVIFPHRLIRVRYVAQTTVTHLSLPTGTDASQCSSMAGYSSPCRSWSRSLRVPSESLIESRVKKT